MKRVCAWCNTVLPQNDAIYDEDTITHGICSQCEKRVEQEFMGAPLENFLNKFSEPVFVINEKEQINVANQKACQFFNKIMLDIQGHKAGDIIECINASRPGGCGKTEACLSCTLRNTVLHTLRTGKGEQGILAVQTLKTPLGEKKFRVKFSAEKVGDIVLVCIDEAVEL